MITKVDYENLKELKRRGIGIFRNISSQTRSVDEIAGLLIETGLAFSVGEAKSLIPSMTSTKPHRERRDYTLPNNYLWGINKEGDGILFVGPHNRAVFLVEAPKDSGRYRMAHTSWDNA